MPQRMPAKAAPDALPDAPGAAVSPAPLSGPLSGRLNDPPYLTITASEKPTHRFSIYAFKNMIKFARPQETAPTARSKSELRHGRGSRPPHS